MSKAIVVGYDATPGAERAVDYAARHARSDDATLHVVAVMPWSLFGIENGMDIEDVQRDVEEHAASFRRDKLDPLLQRLREDGLRVQAHVENGRVAEGMLDVAKREGATSIVVGRRGHGRLAAALLGSTGFALAQSSPLPLTIVP